jgi:arylsulfatase A-like enzyme
MRVALALLAATWVIGLGACRRPVTPPSLPHCVVIVVDDLGYGDAGFCGAALATPRLDALARESLVLERFYAAPMCSPSRAQLMTGKDAPSLGLTRNFKPDDEGGLPLSEVTVADRLRGAGYHTALVGKWHLGHAAPEQRPERRGFQDTYGPLRGWIDYTTHAIEGERDWYRNGAPLDEPGYSTDLIAAEAVRTILLHRSPQPLFLVVSFNAPHAPLAAPPGTSDLSDPRAVYAAMVARLDERIGDVLAALDTRGIAGDTLLWFLSDNGANPRHGGDNGALRGGKYSCDEGALRVPALVRWPGKIAPGRCAEFLSVMDVAPTIEARAGLAAVPGRTGLDVWSSLTLGDSLPVRALCFGVDQVHYQARAVLRAPYKLIEERRDGVATRRLFDVATDPFERDELTAQRPDLVRALETALPE